AAAADVAQQLVEIGMQHGLAAAEGDDRGAELGQFVDTPLHGGRWHRFRDFVVLVAVAAVDVASPDRDDLDEQRMGRVYQPARKFPRRSELAACRRENGQDSRDYSSQA